MEFPHLGQHCSESECGKLDFLPVKCDGCNKIFCIDHYSYYRHNCPTAHKDVQVPVCPLCNALIPGKADELPDIRVSRHIDSNCNSDTAVSRRKVYSNRCSLKGCKQKELVPVLCDTCNLNFCLKHRHPQDHSCTKPTGKPASKSGLAALSRVVGMGQQSASSQSHNRNESRNATSRTPSNPPTRIRNISSLQGNLSEEDALRLAMEASLSGQGNTSSDLPTNVAALTQEQEDFMLAKALAESEMAAAGGAQSSTANRRQQNCDIC